MNPDLPLADGEPDDNETRRPPTGTAGTGRARHTGRRRARGARGAVVLLAAVAVLLAGAPHAHADSNLDQQKQALQHKIAQTKKDLGESSKSLTAAVVALEKSQAALEVAKQKLAQTQRDLAAAKKKDAQMAAKLKAAQEELAAATKAVADGERKIAEQKQKVGMVVGTQFQQKTNLFGLAILARNTTTQDLSNRVQWSSMMFDATQQAMDQLKALQAKLVKDQATKSRIEVQVAADRKAAAENLKTTKALERQAEAAKKSVAAQVQHNAAAKKKVAAEVEATKKQLAGQQAEEQRVERKIQARIAAEKAAAARRAAQARAAAKRAAAQRAADHRAAQRQARTTSRSATRSSHHGFIFPVDGPITSPYGMRVNPVSHQYRLHTGTDFGVGCGTPIRAPYAGTVTERYYQIAYGNRLFIDHGQVDGVYVTTVMNHATHYIVSVGQHVQQGQVVGYVGETGWATGCHLHLMVYLNGKMSNPMSWF